MNSILEFLLKGAVKSLPHIAAKLATKEFLVKDLTIEELTKVFLSNRNSPQCFTTATSLDSEQVIAICQGIFSQKQIKVLSDTTKDNWQVLLADKAQAFFGFGFDSVPHKFLVAVSREGQTTKVIIGCRFTEIGKIDVFNTYKAESIKRINLLAEAIQPNIGLIDLTSAN